MEEEYKDLIASLFILILFIALFSFCMYLIQENSTLRSNYGNYDLLVQEYGACDSFRQNLNECLYTTKAVDYEHCYWFAFEQNINKYGGHKIDGVE